MTKVTEPTFRLVQPVIDATLLPAQVLKGSKGSAAGYSAVSSWQTCPERMRLYAKGVRPVASYDGLADREDISARDLGTLAHHLRAVRYLYGADAALEVVFGWRAHLPAKPYGMLVSLFRLYEELFPLALEPLKVLGVEVDVVSNIGPHVGASKPVLRSVRYDTVVVAPGVGGAGAELFSFEAKTMSRGGTSALNAYMGQAMTHVAVWNANEVLVAQYGRMRGVLFDCLVKTASPSVERRGPFYFGAPHMRLTYRYLAQSDTGDVQFRVQDDGKFPRMLHSCWGRWEPCEYIGACHEESYHAYEYKDGTPYDGR